MLQSKMKIRNLILVFIFPLVKCKINSSMIAEYFNSKFISTITILSCWERREKAKLLRELSQKKFQISFSIESLTYYTDRRDGAVLDISCPNVHEFLSQINKEKWLSTGKEWLFVDLTLENEDMQENFPKPNLDVLADSYILPASYVTLAQITATTIYYYDIFRVLITTPLKVNLLGVQRKGEPLVLNERTGRDNFDNALFDTATVVYSPEVFKGLEDLDRPEVDTWPKVHYPVMKIMAEQLNFSYNIIITDDYGWDINGTGDFNGLMGCIQRKEIEFGFTGCFMREDRRKIADFTQNIFAIGSALIFKQPTLSSVSNIYLLPFTKTVWIACGSLTLLVIALLIIELWVSKYHIKEPYDTKVNVIDLATSILGLICQQGTTINAKSVPARIILFIFSLSVVFFYTSYSANIVALLQSTTPVIKTLNDLTNSRLGIKILEQTYNHVYFKEATDSDVINLYNKKVKPFGAKAYCNPIDGIALVRTGHYAYNVDTNIGYKVISDTFAEKEKCGLSAIKMFRTPQIALPTAKRSGYKELLGVKITKQMEVGLVNRVKQIWIPPKPPCHGKGRGFNSVGLTDFLPSIFAFLYGAAIAFLVFMVEILIFRQLKNRKIKNLIKFNIFNKFVD